MYSTTQTYKTTYDSLDRSNETGTSFQNKIVRFIIVGSSPPW